MCCIFQLFKMCGSWAGELALVAKCLLCKHADPSRVPSAHVKPWSCALVTAVQRGRDKWAPGACRKGLRKTCALTASSPKNTPSSAHTNKYTFISHTHTDIHRCTKTQKHTHRHTDIYNPVFVVPPE